MVHSLQQHVWSSPGILAGYHGMLSTAGFGQQLLALASKQPTWLERLVA
jgi:hypothetical protein